MGYRLNRLDEPVLIAVSKPLLTEFGIHRLESFGTLLDNSTWVCFYVDVFFKSESKQLLIYLSITYSIEEMRVLPLRVSYCL